MFSNSGYVGLVVFPVDAASSACCNAPTFDLSMRYRAKHFLTAMLLLLVLDSGVGTLSSRAATSKQESLDEWRNLTSPSALPPRVFVKGDHIRFYFPTPAGFEAFSAHWSRLRVPTGSYRVNSALVHWDQKLTAIPEGEPGWREATVIAGAEWRQLATNLISELTPGTPSHGAYYQAFLADRLVYRDAEGSPRVVPLSEQPTNVVIERRFSMEETLELLAHRIEEHLVRTHPAHSLFLMMAPNAKRFTQPLLLDREQRQCVFLAPAALYDMTDRGFSLSPTAQGLSALLPESHGIALIKNPVSSAARLVDLGFMTVVRFLRLPLPKPGTQTPPLGHGPGMDLPAWENWLDTYTGTRRQDGSLQLQIDGDRFFPRLTQAIAEATNHIHVNLYIFDKDDVAVSVADQLKQRASEVEVRLILDRLGSIGGGVMPPVTPMPEDFVSPSSILSYLRQNADLQVRSFLNPWLSSDHAKVILIDGARGWVGGMNIGREYRYEWHDLMVELGGPVVASLETEFKREWAHAGPLGDLAYTATLLGGPHETMPSAEPNPWSKVRLLPTKTGWKPFAAAVLGSIRHARSYIYVENPYLFDKRVILDLVNARNRGVDVRVVLPCVNDFKAGGRSNLVIANYLREHGVRVYFYPAMTHVKALLVDGWAILGSGNLNHLSLRVNQEQNIATSDRAFAAELRRTLFETDFARCYELTEPVSVDWVDFLADLVLEGL
jgi:cardiolipin synthase